MVDLVSIVIRHTGLVKSIAKRIANKLDYSIELDDLISEGYIGLMQASKRYDPSTGNKFSTLASPYIRGTILNYVNRKNKLMHVPEAWDEDKAEPYKVHLILSQSIDPTDSTETETNQDQIKFMDDFTNTEVIEFVNTLKPKQRKVLSLIMDEYSMPEAGKELGMTHQAVSYHMKNIKKAYIAFFAKGEGEHDW